MFICPTMVGLVIKVVLYIEFFSNPRYTVCLRCDLCVSFVLTELFSVFLQERYVCQSNLHDKYWSAMRPSLKHPLLTELCLLSSGTWLEEKKLDNASLLPVDISTFFHFV